MEKRTREAVLMIEAQAYIGEQLKLCRRTHGLQAPQKCANLAVEYLHMVQYNDIRAPMYPEGLYRDNKKDLKQDVTSN